MEWVETTGKTVEEAKEAALDELGVDAEDAEFEVVESPRPGLFGRMRGEARVRTRVKPAEVRPKADRRRRDDRSSGSQSSSESSSSSSSSPADASTDRPAREDTRPAPASAEEPAAAAAPAGGDAVGADDVGAAAVDFVEGLVKSFGVNATVELRRDDTELDVSVDGDELGVLIGPRGQTVAAVQNLARVAAQRRLGDHETRLRVDVGGYRQRRKVALEGFVRQVADEVRTTGTPRLLEPMTSADRKIVHDVINETDGIVTRSQGDDPQRRVVLAPAP